MIALWKDPKRENVCPYYQEEVHQETDHGSKEKQKAFASSDGDTSTNPTVAVKHTLLKSVLFDYISDILCVI